MPLKPKTSEEWLALQQRRRGLARLFYCERSRCQITKEKCIRNQESKPLMVMNKGVPCLSSWQDPFLSYCRSGDCAQGKGNRSTPGALRLIRALRKKEE